MYLNLFDLSDVVNITCIVHYGIEINKHTYIHMELLSLVPAGIMCDIITVFMFFYPVHHVDITVSNSDICHGFLSSVERWPLTQAPTTA